MEHSTLARNLLTIVFILGALYFVFKHNDVPVVALHSFEESSQTRVEAPSDGLSTAGVPRTEAPGPLQTIVKKAALLRKSASSVSVTQVITATNTERAKNDRAPLTESTRLNASALVKAKDILARQYFEHIAPDGTNVSQLVDEQGYAYVRIGENLALGAFADSTAVVDAWMESAGHRANILQSSYTEIGVGVAEGYYKGDKVIVAVQHFGRPRSLCPAIDMTLQKKIVDGQSSLDAFSVSLQSLKKEIDQQRGSGVDITDLAASYNDGVDTYDAQYSVIDGLRATYNTQVDLFNACLEALPE